jgi:hypothetical protein
MVRGWLRILSYARQARLTPEPLFTQVIPRGRRAQLLATFASTSEEIADEVQAMQKSDTLEAEEPFAKGQKGSSAMPHKRNPITAERVVLPDSAIGLGCLYDFAASDREVASVLSDLAIARPLVGAGA